jgi:hypothetical protein
MAIIEFCFKNILTIKEHLEKREKGMEVLLKKSAVPRRKPLALAKTERHAWSEGTTSPDPWADCALREKSQLGGHP